MEKKNDPNMQKLDMDQLATVSGGTEETQPTRETPALFEETDTTHKTEPIEVFQAKRGPR